MKLEWHFARKSTHYINSDKIFCWRIEKSFLYDSIAKSAKREDQVDYVQRQAHKIQQKPQEGGGKLRFVLTDKELATINRILDSNFVSIEIVRHKFFSGTWATNILFQNENSFCEYNFWKWRIFGCHYCSGN